MSDVFESRGFKIGALFFGGINIAFSAWVFAISRTLLASNNSPISTTEAKWLWWVSLFWLILSILFFVWCAWRLIFAQTFRVNVVSNVGNYATTTQSGFSPDLFTTSDKLSTTGTTLKKGAKVTTVTTSA